MSNGKKIDIKVAGLTVSGMLDMTPAARTLFDALPISGTVNTWGDELYFTITENVECDEFAEVVNVGDIAFWKPGNALCIFFGLTPMSSPGVIRPASPVTIVGRVEDDPKTLKKAKRGDTIEIYRAE